MVASDPMQTGCPPDTDAIGSGKTGMVILPESGAVQPGVPFVVALTRFTVALAVGLKVTVAVPEPFKTTV